MSRRGGDSVGRPDRPERNRGRGGARGHAGRARCRGAGGARQQGDAGDGGGAGHADGARGRRGDRAGRLRAQCRAAMHHRATSRGAGAAHSDGVGRPVPHLEPGARGGCNGGRSVAPPDLENGKEDHRRLRQSREQSARGDRGAFSVRPAVRGGGRGRPSPVGGARVRRVRGRVGPRAGWFSDDGAAHSVRAHPSRPCAGRGGASLRSGGGGDPHLRAGGRRAVPGVRARTRGGRGGRDRPHRVQCGERGGGGAVPRGQDPVRADRGDHRARARDAPGSRRGVARDGARRRRGRAAPGAGGGVLLNFAALIVVLGPLIFVHEMGHVLAAKAVGIQVLRFSIGFWRPIFSWRRGETESLGGLRFGDRIGRVNGDTVRSWNALLDHILAGPTTLRFAVAGRREPIVVQLSDGGLAPRQALAQALPRLDPPRLGLVEPGRPAIRAGPRPGDLLLRANGDTVRSWSEVLRTVWSSPDMPVRFDVLRDGQIVQVTVVPERKVETDSASPRPHVYGAIGAAPNPPTIHVREPLGRAIVSGFQETWGRGVVVLGFLKGLVLHQTSFREVGGIITVGQISGQVARLGLDWLLTFVAFFSINLAILNLLPIPILDGGQLMFLIAEAVRGKPLSRELRTRLSNVGFFLLVVLMVLALTNDAIRILPR